MAVADDLRPVRDAKIFVGCPMYDGRAHAEFTFAMCQLSALCTAQGISLQLYFASGEALVMKARNAIADHFLRSDASHLMLIDADIGFQATDVLSLLALQTQQGGTNEYDVVSAPYPMKRIAWEQLAQAVRQGLVDADPAMLRHYASELLLRPAQSGSFALHQPLAVTAAGTGFMMIRRQTLERYAGFYPQRRYRSSGIGIEQDCSEQIIQFFDTAIIGQADTLQPDLRQFLTDNPQAAHQAILDFLNSREAICGEYVSEDFLFCRLVRDMGLKLWSCPWINLTHIGSFAYQSRLVQLAQLGG